MTVSYDFRMDSFVGVEGPQLPDGSPVSGKFEQELRERAWVEFKRRVAVEYDPSCLELFQIYNEEDGTTTELIGEESSDEKTNQD